MKVFLSILLLLSTYISGSAQQRIEDFFHNPGVSDLAGFAHPTSTYENGTYTIYEDCIIVDINYANNYHLRLRVERGGLWGFNKLTVLEDNDYMPAFSALWILMSAAREHARRQNNHYDEITNYLAVLLDKQVDNWNGTDWALCLLILDYNANN